MMAWGKILIVLMGLSERRGEGEYKSEIVLS